MPKPTIKKADTGFTMRRRSLSVVTSSVNLETWTVDMIATTETPATQWIPDPNQTGSFSERRYVEADEVLGMDGVDFSRATGMPFGDSHNLSFIENVLSKIISLNIDGTRLLATASFQESKLQVPKEMAVGHLPQVSIGYCVHEYEMIPRTDGVNRPMVRAIRWTPHEISSVPVGADVNAVIGLGYVHYDGLLKDRESMAAALATSKATNDLAIQTANNNAAAAKKIEAAYKVQIAALEILAAETAASEALSRQFAGDLATADDIEIRTA